MDTMHALMENYLNLGKEKGFDNVSLREIADATGIRKASIFSHFRDFSDLKEQSVRHCLEQIGKRTFEINPKASDAEELFLELINSFIDVFTGFPSNALLYMIDQRKTYDTGTKELSNRIDLMIKSRFVVALDFCYQRRWTENENTEETAELLTVYMRNLLIKENMSDDDLSDMLNIILHLL